MTNRGDLKRRGSHSINWRKSRFYRWWISDWKNIYGDQLRMPFSFSINNWKKPHIDQNVLCKYLALGMNEFPSDALDRKPIKWYAMHIWITTVAAHYWSVRVCVCVCLRWPTSHICANCYSNPPHKAAVKFRATTHQAHSKRQTSTEIKIAFFHFEQTTNE